MAIASSKQLKCPKKIYSEFSNLLEGKKVIGFEFFTKLAHTLHCSEKAAKTLWYCYTTEWFLPEMVVQIISVMDNPKEHDFIPLFFTNNFLWNGERFIKNEKYTSPQTG